ncbi:hypothetical protein CTRI78_v002532 [Colletotrichum trifolii]|uniref:Bromo domain-containing protein n=1 Tax=Colletotrichum trifolii TaxID=5466 RepID=A0A4R8RXH2_COLTR|nr:hypothetical protein CTRI78_v002532 [Colletotrichum trifolii]
MNDPAVYTPLESLFLFRALCRHGLDAAAFAAVSIELINNKLIKDDQTYDAARLSPDALRNLFLHLWTQELGRHAVGDRSDGSSSPVSKKRKLSRPPLPTLKEAKEQLDKLPAFIDGLYASYKDWQVKRIREDEDRLGVLVKEVKELDRLDMEEKAKAIATADHIAAEEEAAAKRRAIAPAVASGQKATPTPVPVPSPMPILAQVAQPQTPIKPPTPTPTPTPARVPAPIAAAVAVPPPAPAPAPAPQPQPVETPRQIRPAPAPASAPAQSTTPTQTPVPVPTPAPRPPQAQIKQPAAQAPTPPPVPHAVQARRDVAPPKGTFQPSPAPPTQPSSISGVSPATPAIAPAIKNQLPPKPPQGAGQVLQLPVGAGQQLVRPGQSASPAPLPAISPRPDGTKPRTPGPPTQALPSTPGTLKWEKPYQPAVPPPQSQGRPIPPQIPTTSAPSTPNQAQHPAQWYPQPGSQYHGPPHPPHVPIQANQSQRHPQQTQPVLVPPQPQGQPQGQTAAQAHAQAQAKAQAHAQVQAQAQAHLKAQAQAQLQPQFQPPPQQVQQAQQQAQQQVQPPQPQPQPQPKGQLVAPMHSAPVKGPPEGSAIQPPQPQARRKSTTPIAPPPRPQLPQHHQVNQQASVQPSQPPQPPAYQHPTPRPIAAASPTPPSATPTPTQTAVAPPRWPHAQQPPYAQSQFSPSPVPVPAPGQLPAKPSDSQRRVSSPVVKQQTPHPAIPPRLVPPGPAPPSPAQRLSNTPIPPPQTPVTKPPTCILTGTGTKWKLQPTPSTPHLTTSSKEVQSPAFEPISPVQQPIPLPTSTPSQAARKPSPKPTPKPETNKPETKTPRGRGRPPRNANKVRAESTPTSAVGLAPRSQSVVSQTDELSMDHNDLAPKVKDENATPRATPRATPKPQDETGDTTADESVPSRRTMVTPSSVSSRLAHKRKRQETPIEAPPVPPTHVLWTRQFGRVSAAALDQIGAHRFANQFANPIRDRDAPGYKTLILQPQDIKSIRAAITHGNRAATEAAKALPDGDPGTGSVLLPISDDLVPPKSIINSAQLERELVHMFSNAIMYNLNPCRGPGPTFMKKDGTSESEVVGYEVDEDAVA